MNGAPDSIDRAMALEATFIDQQVLHSESTKGDCFRACLATILRKPIQAVPHFALLDFAPDVFVAMECAQAWLNSKGYEMWMGLDDGVNPLPLCIVSGVSPRGIPHAVVGDTATGQILHDPHPSRDGLSHISNRLYLFPISAQVGQPAQGGGA